MNAVKAKNYDDRFIVKIFEKTDKEPFFWGTGFLYDEYLISASHVFRGRISEQENCIGKGEYFFEFENKRYPLENVFYDEYEHGDDMDAESGICKDLRIYKVGNYNSPYRLFDNEYSWKTKLYFDGWCVDEKGVIINLSNSEVIAEEAYYYDQNHIKKPIRLKNCFRLDATKAVEGNSGCPILDENIIYGMYFGSQEYGSGYEDGKAIRSDYILGKMTQNYC